MQDVYALLYVYQLSEGRVKSTFECSFWGTEAQGPVE